MRTQALALVLAAAAFVLGAGCARSTAGGIVGDTAARPVDVAPVRFSAAAIPVEAAGVLCRKEETDLSFKTGGVVDEVLVRAGDAVVRGQILARLKEDELRARAQQAHAAMDKAQRDAARMRDLLINKVVATEEVENAETAATQAQAASEAEDFNMRQSVIEAPDDGVILYRRAERDEVVAGGQPVLGFASTNSTWLACVHLAAADVMRIRPGDAALLTEGEQASASVTAVVQRIAGAASADTRTTEVELESALPPDGAQSGFVVHVRIQPRPVTARPVVPASALVEGAEHTASIFVLDAGGGHVRRVSVEVVALYGSDAYLAGGVGEGTRVVTRGAEYLRDGEAVRVASSAP